MDMRSSARHLALPRISTESSKLKPLTRVILAMVAAVLMTIAIACSPKDEVSPTGAVGIKAGDTPTQAQKDAMRAQRTGGRPGGSGGRPMGGPGGYGGGYGGYGRSMGAPSGR
jgi:hypothetical protein